MRWSCQPLLCTKTQKQMPTTSSWRERVKKAHQKTVQVGIRNGEDAQIVSGINAGDPVITAGGYAVPDGTKIKVEKPEAPEKAGADKEGADKADKKDADDADDKDKKDSGDKKDEKKGGAAAKS